MTRRPDRTARLSRLVAILFLACGLVLSSGARAADPPAAANPAAEAGTALLSVTSGVEGARVWVDAVEVGTVPLTRYLPVGTHQLRVAANGYDPFVRRIVLEKDLVLRVEAHLTAGRGTVEFVSNVPGARVFLDGREVGPAPIRLSDVTPGDHVWRMEAPGHESAWEPFTFTTGENLLIPVTLDPSRGLFAVRSDPPGALVVLDGTGVGHTPLDLTGISEGIHGVELRLPGYADVFRSVDTTDGSKGEVTATLLPGGATLDVRTGRADASVAVNDCPVGTGSRVRISSVAPGTVQITVQAPGQATALRQVSVPRSGRVALRVRFQPAAGNVRSVLEEVPPLYRRWRFWAVAGGLAAAGAAGGAALAVTLTPEPPPHGDVTVTLP